MSAAEIKELRKQAKEVVKRIRVETEALRDCFSDERKMESSLLVLKARFSKVELLLIEMEKVKSKCQNPS
jgi:hypothetical protein